MSNLYSGVKIWGAFSLHWDYNPKIENVDIKLFLGNTEIANTVLSIDSPNLFFDKSNGTDLIYGEIYLTFFNTSIVSIGGEFDYAFNNKKFYYSGTIIDWEEHLLEELVDDEEDEEEEEEDDDEYWEDDD